jgi:hypothetical protein
MVRIMFTKQDLVTVSSMELLPYLASAKLPSKYQTLPRSRLFVALVERGFSIIIRSG